MTRWRSFERAVGKVVSLFCLFMWRSQDGQRQPTPVGDHRLVISRQLWRAKTELRDSNVGDSIIKQEHKTNTLSDERDTTRVYT